MHQNQSSGHGFSVLQRTTWLISGEAMQLVSRVATRIVYSRIQQQGQKLVAAILLQVIPQVLKMGVHSQVIVVVLIMSSKIVVQLTFYQTK